MSEERVFLSLGSNLGDRLAHLKAALSYLQSQGLVIDAESSVWETAPWGVTAQPAFFNMCIAARTSLTPQDMLQMVKEAERSLGRKESFRWGPREIDIDIIFFGSLILESPSLIIPHPHMHERGFVLGPLAEIAGSVEHPVTRISVDEMLAALPENERHMKRVSP